LLGEEAEINFCNDPSDIIWENLECGYFGRKLRYFVVAFIILIFFIISSIVFSVLRVKANTFVEMFPTTT
jgi:hypothetical protein